MLASILIAAALWPSSVMQQCNPHAETSIVGIAQSAAGHFLYCEQIEIASERGLNIVYFNNGKQFAEKKIDYRENPATPSVKQIDFRTREVRIATINQQELELQYQGNRKEKVQRINIPLAEVDVVDAGFDYFIRQHWNELQTGKILPVNFASIAHQKALPLRVRMLAPEKCAEDANPIHQHHCYFVEVDNALLRLVLGNIKLTYDEQRRLINFKGVVNIEDDKGSAQNASIHYYYKSDYRE
jgi:hypothetical protein